MKETNFTTRFRVQGVFSIEMAMIAVFMSGILVFSSDMVIKQSTQGMLDRMSYSAVSIIKERTQLYPSDDSKVDYRIMTQAQILSIDDIVTRSLWRTMPSFDSSRYSAVYQEYYFDENDSSKDQNISYSTGIESSSCKPPITLDETEAKALSPITNEDRRAPVFEVTICYRTDNWYGSLVGGDYEWIRSNSIMLGR